MHLEARGSSLDVARQGAGGGSSASSSSRLRVIFDAKLLEEKERKVSNAATTTTTPTPTPKALPPPSSPPFPPPSPSLTLSSKKKRSSPSSMIHRKSRRSVVAAAAAAGGGRHRHRSSPPTTTKKKKASNRNNRNGRGGGGGGGGIFKSFRPSSKASNPKAKSGSGPDDTYILEDDGSVTSLFTTDERSSVAPTLSSSPSSLPASSPPPSPPHLGSWLPPVAVYDTAAERGTRLAVEARNDFGGRARGRGTGPVCVDDCSSSSGGRGGGDESDSDAAPSDDAEEEPFVVDGLFDDEDSVACLLDPAAPSSSPVAPFGDEGSPSLPSSSSSRPTSPRPPAKGRTREARSSSPVVVVAPPSPRSAAPSVAASDRTACRNNRTKQDVRLPNLSGLAREMSRFDAAEDDDDDDRDGPSRYLPAWIKRVDSQDLDGMSSGVVSPVGGGDEEEEERDGERSPSASSSSDDGRRSRRPPVKASRPLPTLPSGTASDSDASYLPSVKPPPRKRQTVSIADVPSSVVNFPGLTLGPVYRSKRRSAPARRAQESVLLETARWSALVSQAFERRDKKERKRKAKLGLEVVPKEEGGEGKKEGLYLVLRGPAPSLKNDSDGRSGKPKARPRRLDERVTLPEHERWAVFVPPPPPAPDDKGRKSDDENDGGNDKDASSPIDADECHLVDDEDGGNDDIDGGDGKNDDDEETKEESRSDDESAARRPPPRQDGATEKGEEEAPSPPEPIVALPLPPLALPPTAVDLDELDDAQPERIDGTSDVRKIHGRVADSLAEGDFKGAADVLLDVLLPGLRLRRSEPSPSLDPDPSPSPAAVRVNDGFLSYDALILSTLRNAGTILLYGGHYEDALDPLWEATDPGRRRRERERRRAEEEGERGEEKKEDDDDDEEEVERRDRGEASSPFAVTDETDDAASLASLGLCLYALSEFDDANRVFLEAVLTLQKKNDDRGNATADRNRRDSSVDDDHDAETPRGEEKLEGEGPREAEEWHDDASPLSDDQRSIVVGKLLNNVGCVFHERREYDKASSTFERAERMYRGEGLISLRSSSSSRAKEEEEKEERPSTGGETVEREKKGSEASPGSADDATPKTPTAGSSRDDAPAGAPSNPSSISKEEDAKVGDGDVDSSSGDGDADKNGASNAKATASPGRKKKKQGDAGPTKKELDLLRDLRRKMRERRGTKHGNGNGNGNDDADAAAAAAPPPDLEDIQDGIVEEKIQEWEETTATAAAAAAKAVGPPPTEKVGASEERSVAPETPEETEETEASSQRPRPSSPPPPPSDPSEGARDAPAVVAPVPNGADAEGADRNAAAADDFDDALSLALSFATDVAESAERSATGGRVVAPPSNGGVAAEIGEAKGSDESGKADDDDVLSLALSLTTDVAESAERSARAGPAGRAGGRGGPRGGGAATESAPGAASTDDALSLALTFATDVADEVERRSSAALGRRSPGGRSGDLLATDANEKEEEDDENLPSFLPSSLLGGGGARGAGDDDDVLSLALSLTSGVAERSSTSVAGSSSSEGKNDGRYSDELSVALSLASTATGKSDPVVEAASPSRGDDDGAATLMRIVQEEEIIDAGKKTNGDGDNDGNGEEADGEDEDLKRENDRIVTEILLRATEAVGAPDEDIADGPPSSPRRRRRRAQATPPSSPPRGTSGEAAGEEEGEDAVIGGGPLAPTLDIVVATCNLGYALVKRKEMGRAVETFERVISLHKDSYEKDYQFVLIALDNLAYINTKRKMYKDAIKNYRDMLQIQDSIFDITTSSVRFHSAKARTYSSMSYAHLQLKEYAEAQRCLNEVLKHEERYLGSDDREVLRTKQSIWKVKNLLVHGSDTMACC